MLESLLIHSHSLIRHLDDKLCSLPHQGQADGLARLREAQSIAQHVVEGPADQLRLPTDRVFPGLIPQVLISTPMCCAS